MNDLRDLYQQLILDHNQHPKNFGRLEHPTHVNHGYNPLCGDKLDLYLEIEDDQVKDIRFDGSGCAISKSSASIMTTVIKGKSRTAAIEIFDQFQTMATTGEIGEGMHGKLAALADVYKYPARVKCAMLAWRTLAASLQENSEIVSTE